VSLLIQGRRNVNAELALRLARYVGTTAEFWIGLQGQYDLDVAQDEAEARIAREVQRCPLLSAAA
jgi:antitoxin HigA-1